MWQTGIVCEVGDLVLSRKELWGMPPNPAPTYLGPRRQGAAYHCILPINKRNNHTPPTMPVPLKFCKSRILINPKLGQALLSPGINSSAVQQSGFGGQGRLSPRGSSPQSQEGGKSAEAGPHRVVSCHSLHFSR